MAEFAKAREFAHRDLQVAEADVARWQHLVAGGLAEAQAELDRARAAWEVKSAKTHAESQRVIEDYEKRRAVSDAEVSAMRVALQGMAARGSVDTEKAIDTPVEVLKIVENRAGASPAQRIELSKSVEVCARRLWRGLEPHSFILDRWQGSGSQRSQCGHEHPTRHQ